MLVHRPGLRRFLLAALALATAGTVATPTPAQAALPNQTAFVYETFIPQQYLAAPGAGCGGYSGSSYSFGGDNRGYVANSSAYRTRVSAVIDWTNGGAITSYCYVGPTRVYRTSDKRLLATASASTAGMKVERLALSNGSHADLRVTVSASNPFCTSLASIDAVFTIIVNRDGNWRIQSGKHKQMPNHEIYLARGGLAATTWSTVYRRSYYSPYCLVNGTCPSADKTNAGYY